MEEATERGRALLQRVAERHGLSAWKQYTTQQVTGVDRWVGEEAGWWPGPTQRFRLQTMLGTFTSRVELLDGPAAGEIWGIQAWQAYTRAAPKSVVEYESVRFDVVDPRLLLVDPGRAVGDVK